MSANHIVLPPTYYLEHQQFLFDFVCHYYADVLNESELSYAEQFQRLSLPARCLYVRMVNRKQKYFRLSELSYIEIGDVQVAIDELVASGFSHTLSTDSTVAMLPLLHCFAKQELLALATHFKLAINKSMAKPVLLAYICQAVEEQALLAWLTQQETMVMPAYQPELQMFKFLFFGSLSTDMTRFVMRDLGHLKLMTNDPGSFTPYFSSRQEAEDCLAVQLAYHEFKQRTTEQSALLVYAWFEQWYAEHELLCEQAQPRLAKLLLKLAKYLEKNVCLTQALNVYRLTEQSPSLERQIRLLSKMGRGDEAAQLCQRLVSHATHAKEQYFALDFMQKLQSKLMRKSTTRYLNDAEVIVIEANQSLKPEQAVMNWLIQQGHKVLYTENYVWRGLFGLIFWNVVFDTKLGILHQPLQTAPSDLYSANFFLHRQAEFKAELAWLWQQVDSLAILRQRYENWYGLTNPMLSWHESLWDSIQHCYSYISPQQLTEVLLEMARDWRHNSCGFPDLFSWHEQNYTFIEVKSPNDQLAEQQLKWLEFFKRIGVNACVKRILWQR
jgi:hypothetical protein